MTRALVTLTFTFSLLLIEILTENSLLGDVRVIDGTTGTQVNCIVTHPTLPLLISAHEDGYIRLFDLNTGSFRSFLDSHYSDTLTPLMFPSFFFDRIRRMYACNGSTSRCYHITFNRSNRSITRLRSS